MKRHTAKYYETRVTNAIAKAQSMGFNPLQNCVLCFMNISDDPKKPMYRNSMLSVETAVGHMVSGAALRLSVTNSERIVEIFVDP